MRTRRRRIGALIGAAAVIALAGATTPAAAAGDGPWRGRSAYRDRGHHRGYDRGYDRRHDWRRDQHRRSYSRSRVRVEFNGGFCEPRWPQVCPPRRVYRRSYHRPVWRSRPSCGPGIVFRF